MNAKMTILVNSCDKYSDIWPYYFEMLYKKWPDCPYPIVLNTETYTYTDKNFNVKVINLPQGYNTNKEVSWTERLIRCVEQIDSKYILFTLDDIYFLDRVVNSDIDELLMKIDSIHGFGMLYFYNYGPKYYSKAKDLYLCHKYCAFNYNITCNLWKKDELLKVFVPGETPWQAEQTIKRNSERRRSKYYCIGENQILHFDIAKYGLIHGQWANPTINLFRENDIVFRNPENRLFYTSQTTNNNGGEWQLYLTRLKYYSKLPYFVYSLHIIRYKISCGIKTRIRKLLS